MTRKKRIPILNSTGINPDNNIINSVRRQKERTMQYNTAEQLKRFTNLPIDWNLDPADAVTLYLEWGNHD